MEWAAKLRGGGTHILPFSDIRYACHLRERYKIECSQKEFRLELARRAEGVHSAHEVVKNLRWVRSDAELEVT